MNVSSVLRISALLTVLVGMSPVCNAMDSDTSTVHTAQVIYCDLCDGIRLNSSWYGKPMIHWADPVATARRRRWGKSKDPTDPVATTRQRA
ncbi:hypothetical protein KEM48_009115 [Puccinia striiformis f. sp. tritici PST-130]|nr:hypothetical protein KEM48_009115 [Puccinia striiformis f. sp. tritici PST-130]